MKDHIVTVVFTLVVGLVLTYIALGATGFWEPTSPSLLYHEWLVPGTSNCWRTPLNVDIPCPPEVTEVAR